MSPALFNVLPYLVFLITGIILTGLLFHKKDGQLSLVRIAIWILWTMILFGFSGVLSARIESLPNAFASTLIVAVVMGIIYLLAAPLTLDWWKIQNTSGVILWNLALLAFGAFSFAAFNVILADSKSYTPILLAGNLGYLLPTLLFKSHDFWMNIPSKKYKTWLYPVHEPIPRLQPIDPIKLMMNFTPVPSGKNGPFESYEVEFPTNKNLSELFHYFICFHNKHREYKKRPIQFLDGDVPLAWVLYKYTPQKKRQYLDMDKTLIENQVYQNEHIYAASSH